MQLDMLRHESRTDRKPSKENAETENPRASG